MDEEGYESGAHPLLVLLGLDMVVLLDWAGLPACRMGFIALALTVRTTFASIVIRFVRCLGCGGDAQEFSLFSTSTGGESRSRGISRVLTGTTN